MKLSVRENIDEKLHQTRFNAVTLRIHQTQFLRRQELISTW